MSNIDLAKGWFSAQELAGLPGLPGDESNIRKHAKKNLWPFRKKLRGKGVEYEKSALPQVTRAYLTALAVCTAQANDQCEVDGNRSTGSTPCVTDISTSSNRKQPNTSQSLGISVLPTEEDVLDNNQLESEIARDRLLSFVAKFDGTQIRALEYLNAGYHAKTLPGPMMWAMDRAWSKPRKDSRLTRETLNQWRRVKRIRGRSAPGKRQRDMEVMRCPP